MSARLSPTMRASTVGGSLRASLPCHGCKPIVSSARRRDDVPLRPAPVSMPFNRVGSRTLMQGEPKAPFRKRPAERAQAKTTHKRKWRLLISRCAVVLRKLLRGDDGREKVVRTAVTSCKERQCVWEGTRAVACATNQPIRRRRDCRHAAWHRMPLCRCTPARTPPMPYSSISWAGVSV
jgi:hypothetical protein